MELDIVSIVLAVIGAVAAIWKAFDAAFWKKIAIESFEVVDVIKKAKDEKSPGGKEFTLEEKAEIGDEAMDVVIPLWDKFAKKLKKE